MKINQYGRVALKTTMQLQLGKRWTNNEAVEIWLDVCESEGLSSSSVDKTCPKYAFLGLCEKGYVKNVVVDQGRHSLEKVYAVRAVNILREVKHTNFKSLELLKMSGFIGKSHNGQIDVVYALWNAGLII